jgi:hypothetical protein
MHKLRQLVSEELLGLVELPILHSPFSDLLKGQKSAASALYDVGVAHVAPVLVEILGRGFLRVEPDRTFCVSPSFSPRR